MTVKEYIKQNWVNTIKIPNSADDKANFRMPVPYCTPCADSLFTTFFYWDTYFANLGLYEDGLVEQAKNNLITMRFFIRVLGFVPNAEHLITRSQPPLYTRGLFDYWKKTGDVDFIRESLPEAEREFRFFELDRNTPCGLNAYGTHELAVGKEWYYEEFDRRIGYTSSEKQLNKDEFVKGLLAIAESGWDFNPRFQKEGNRFASRDFAHLDLNCILFDAEQKASQLFEAVGNLEKSKFYAQKATERKQKINCLMKDPASGIYFDYDYKKGQLSGIISAAAFYPYALGISDDTKGLKSVLRALELPYGISACAYRGEKEKYWQWDYPSMWPTNVYFCYEGLNNCGLSKDAQRISDKYTVTVENCFEKTGKLWEKYDASKGTVSVTTEYDTPDMMGWTAGIYRYLQEKK